MKRSMIDIALEHVESLDEIKSMLGSYLTGTRPHVGGEVSSTSSKLNPYSLEATKWSLTESYSSKGT